MIITNYTSQTRRGLCTIHALWNIN